MSIGNSKTSLPMELLRIDREGTDLTRREKAVLKLLAMGETQPSIARMTGRSLETIKQQSKSARARLRAKTNTQAVAIAVSLDLI